MNGGVCEDAVNGYYCTCLPGYTGTRCHLGKIFLLLFVVVVVVYLSTINAVYNWLNK